MKRIQRQLSASVMTPPSSTPAAPPAPPMAPQMPTARLRSCGSVKVLVRIESEAGRDHRAAETLDQARDDQHGARVGQTAGERGEREEHEAEDEDAAAAEQVGGAAAEEQEPGEGHRVGVDHPLQPVLA